MAIKKDLTEELNTLVHHIMEKTESPDDWVTLTYRDIAKIVGTTPGSSVTKRLMESLKEHENILFKLNLDPSKSKKPLQFQFVDKETKYKAIDNKRYHNLTDQEVNFVKDTLGYRDHNELYNILAFINYLKSMYGTEPFDMPSAADLSDDLVILEEDVTNIIKFLQNSDILIDEDNKYRIFLSKTDLGKIVNSNENNKLIDEKPTTPRDLHLINSKSTDEALVYLLNQMESQQSILRAYIEQKVMEEIGETTLLKKQLDEGHEAIQKVLADNSRLRDENRELKAKLGKFEGTAERAARFKDDLINAAQEYLQVFSWQVQQVALRDSNMSPDIKNSKAYRAKLFQEYVDVGQEFYQNIVDFTKD